MTEHRERCQTIVVTLDDGRTGIFTGRVLVETDEPPRRITGVKFTAPQLLPAEYTFENLNESEVSDEPK